MKKNIDQSQTIYEPAFTLYKFFEREFAEKLTSGYVRLSTIEHFRPSNPREKKGSGTYDWSEGVYTFTQNENITIKNKDEYLFNKEYYDKFMPKSFPIITNIDEIEDNTELNLIIGGNEFHNFLQYNAHIFCCSRSRMLKVCQNLQGDRISRIDTIVPIEAPYKFGRALQKAYCDKHGFDTDEWGFVSRSVLYKNMRANEAKPSIVRPSLWHKDEIFSHQKEYRFAFSPKCESNADYVFLEFDTTKDMFGDLIDISKY